MMLLNITEENREIYDFAVDSKYNTLNIILSLSLSLSASFPRISVPYVTLVLFLFSVWIIMCCKVYTLNGKLLRCAPWYFLFWVFQGKKKYARVIINEENKSLVSVEMLRGTFGFVCNQIVHHNLYKLLIV